MSWQHFCCLTLQSYLFCIHCPNKKYKKCKKKIKKYYFVEIINTFNPIMQKYGNKIGVFCGWLETFRCVWNDFFKQKYGFVDKSGMSFNSAKGIIVSDFVSFHMFLGVKMFPYSDPICGMLSISVSCGIGFLSLCLAPNFWSFTHVVNILCPEGASLFPPSS